ncbi:adenosine deaminase-like protein isoform X2 [Zootermopsis nevadensis]|uniref:adenosine deaminase-like protein isoform X2 n=1 Tax=Zootermopsis nevadensis TaxID=136037 RepID=UPI000B8EBD2F|nr:adenosine deaminase-like protein isoform X2 [Zootermopsis nevadensis]
MVMTLWQYKSTHERYYFRGTYCPNLQGSVFLQNIGINLHSNLADQLGPQITHKELHAHLNGSLSTKTLRELIELQKPLSDNSDATWNIWEAIIEHGQKRTLEECFQIFGIAHSLTTTPATVYKATQDVIKEFVDDGVRYLELRSTPRNVPQIMSKAQYIQAMVDAIQGMTDDQILVKLMVSIDRRQGKESASETVDAAVVAYHQNPKIIVGLDLSGDPTKGLVSDYLPVLARGRNAGLKISIHCAEVPNSDEVEEILNFHPDRLGHCTCIHPLHGGSQELWIKLLHSHIPVELCLTSNVKCGTVENYKKHHFIHLFTAKHPIVLATDDKGVFATSLSEEYVLAANSYDLSKEQLWKMTMSSIDYTFASEEEKNRLKQMFMQIKELSDVQ